MFNAAAGPTQPSRRRPLNLKRGRKVISVDITPVITAGRQLIERYGDGGFVIAGERYKSSMLVFPERSVAWDVPTLADLTIQSLTPVIDMSDQTDILVFGCGANFTDEPTGLRGDLREHGIVLEWMDTGAACRTYNVLLAEDRLLAAALIAVQ